MEETAVKVCAQKNSEENLKKDNSSRNSMSWYGSSDPLRSIEAEFSFNYIASSTLNTN